MISRSFFIVSISFLFLPPFSFPLVILSTFSYPFLPSHIVSSVFYFLHMYKLFGYLTPLCWISTTESKVSSQQAITIKRSRRTAAKRETSLKLETYRGVFVGFFKWKIWGLAKNSKSASYCICNFQL